MNVERQLIGSLLLDSTRIDDMQFVEPDMFTDSTMGEIFALYKTQKTVDQIVITQKLKSDYFTETVIAGMLGEIVSEHDAGISDKHCAEEIYNRFRVRKITEYIDHTQITPQNIDVVIDDFKSFTDFLSKPSESKARTLSDLVDTYRNDYFVERKNKKQFKFGFEKIDKAIGGLDDGDVIVIAARPGVGKSAFSLQALRKFGRDGYKVGYFNLEMGERQVYERAVSTSSEIDMTRIRLATNFLNDEKLKFDKGNEELLKENNVFTFTGTQSLQSIRSIQKKEQFQLIVIDYLQLINTGSKRSNRASEVGDISRGLKAIARDFSIPVIALSQLNRASEMNKDKEPLMSELRESGDIEQDASVIIMLWNSNPEDLREKKIKVEKSRNGYVERETLYFDGKHMTFSAVDTGFNSANSDELPWS